MEYVERVPLPEVCLGCEDRAGCLARGEGEWCCEECEHLLERFGKACALSQLIPIFR